LQAAVTRYRALALTVGVMLLLLVFVAMPIRYFGGNATPSAIISPTHGVLYIIYLVMAYDLWRKMRWPVGKMVLMVSAGLIPFLAFFIEHKVVREARAELAGRSAEEAPAPANS
jgi:integral membrane protein